MSGPLFPIRGVGSHIAGELGTAEISEDLLRDSCGYIAEGACPGQDWARPSDRNTGRRHIPGKGCGPTVQPKEEEMATTKPARKRKQIPLQIMGVLK